jgi:hypothetical protein
VSAARPHNELIQPARSREGLRLPGPSCLIRGVVNKKKRFIGFLVLTLLLLFVGVQYFKSEIAELQSEIDSLESLLAAAPSMERSKLRSLLRSTGIQERGIHLRLFQVFKNDGGFTKSFLELFSITELEHAELLKVSMYVQNEYYRLSKKTVEYLKPKTARCWCKSILLTVQANYILIFSRHSKEC